MRMHNLVHVQLIHVDVLNLKGEFTVYGSKGFLSVMIFFALEKYKIGLKIMFDAKLNLTPTSSSKFFRLFTKDIISFIC